MTPRTDRTKLRALPAPINSEHHWRRLLNRLYLDEEDELFRWVQRVRREVCEKEKPKPKEAA